MNGFTPGIPLGANCTKTMTLMRYRKFYKETKELLNEYLLWRITNEQLQRD